MDGTWPVSSSSCCPDPHQDENISQNKSCLPWLLLSGYLITRRVTQRDHSPRTTLLFPGLGWKSFPMRLNLGVTYKSQGTAQEKQVPCLVEHDRSIQLPIGHFAGISPWLCNQPRALLHGEDYPHPALRNSFKMA